MTPNTSITEMMYNANNKPDALQLSIFMLLVD